MKLDSPKRKAAKAAMKAQMWATAPPKTKASAPQRASWWVPLAAPDLPREQFTAAARARDAEMQRDPTWKRPDKLQQVGQL